MSLPNSVKKFLLECRLALRSTKGRNVVLYLMCVCVAFLFWIFLSLDNEVQRDYEIPVEIDNVPDSVVIIGSVPRTINAMVQAKGSQLIRFWGGRTPVLKLKFTDYATADRTFEMSRMKIDSRLKEYFGQAAQIINVRPDSIYAPFTTTPGKVLPLKINLDVKASLQSIISGAIISNFDSVKVYSDGEIPSGLHQIETELGSASDLKDTTVFDLKIKQLPGMRIIPERVKVTVPVEPLISKRRMVPVEVTNLPEGSQVVTFPSSVEVSYLVPMSAFNDDYPLKVTIDASKIDLSKPKTKVMPSLTPDHYHNVTFHPDSVEYIFQTSK